ncbi:hypothetical protein [uncultured Microscilla sp.]|uniref:hypothetical protein n=1 Tax=uncultured Microscilla sp. TaxID=432653 RepID=UPI00261C7A44|nr:hypothetical protein [uncultured Microscilla sp.]
MNKGQLVKNQDKNQQENSNHTIQQKKTAKGIGTIQRKGGYIAHTSNQSGQPPIQSKQAPVSSKHKNVVKLGGHNHNNENRGNVNSSPSGEVIQRKETDPPWYERAWNAAGEAVDYIGDKTTEASEYVSGKMEEGSVYLLNKVLPVGVGVAVQLNGGITWGIPLHTGGSAICYLKRIDENTVNILVRKQGTLAFDTGVGASAMIGKTGSGGKPGAGIGGEAGANFQAGIQGTGIEEFNIPVPQFLMFAGKSALSNMLKMNMMTRPINNLLKQNADQYRIRQRIEVGVFAQADAEAGIGVRRPSDDFQGREGRGDTQYGASGWGREGDRDFQGSAPKLVDVLGSKKFDPLALLNLLSVFASAQVRGQIAGGVDQKSQGKKTITSLYLEGEVTSMINIPIPFLSQFLQMIPSGGGAGVELQFTQEAGKETQTNLKVYQKSGEDQVYAGAANNQTFNINLTNLLPTNQILASLKKRQMPNISIKAADMKKAFEKVSFFNRMLLTGGATKKLKGFLRKQQGTRSLLSDKTKSKAENFGGSYAVYLDLGGQMTGPDFMAIVQKIFKIGKEAYDASKDSESVSQTFKALQDFFAGKADSPELMNLLDDVLDGYKVDTALIRIEGSLGLGISGKLSAGAKVRGDLSAQGGAFVEMDYVKKMGQEGRMNLRHLLAELPKVLNNPLDYFPGNSLIKMLYEDE